MLIFSTIPGNYLTDMQRIERTSNPYPWRAESLADSYQQFQHLGVFDGTTLIAFVLYRTIADEAEIIHIVCDKAYQGKGYAQQLLAELRKQLLQNAIKTLFLEVRDNNVSAKRVYERLGFVTVGRRSNYYGGKHDALIQQLSLTH